MLKKLSSRKFWIALIGAIGGLAAAFSGQGGDIGFFSGMIVTATSLVSYILVEGRIDYKSVVVLVEDLEEVIEKIKKESDK